VSAGVDGSPFGRRTVLALVVGGAALFVALLWMIATGWGGSSLNDGGAHAASRGLTGYAGLVDYLEARGIHVSRSQDHKGLASPGLLVLTPPANADGKALEKALNARRYIGPTLVVNPKWIAFPASADGVPHKRGWVRISGTVLAGWKGFLDDLAIGLDPLPGGRWQGAGLAGTLPEPRVVLSGTGKDLVPLVTSADGKRVLAGYIEDDGYYPGLAALAGREAGKPDDDNRIYPLVVVFEPDLLDNYGLRDGAGALLAERLIRAAGENGKGVTFDMTFDGYTRSANLLTLAFTPPFLAPTVCLLFAAIVAGWRAFLRFGPARQTGPGIAFGKRALVANSAGLIARTRRFHLLAEPYASAVRERLVHQLALSRQAAPGQTDAAIDRAIGRRDAEAVPFSESAARLISARKSRELVAAAQDLHALERTLTR
jgi:hypothetical protein